MVFRMLEIDWSSLIEQGQLLWAGIITLCGGTLLNIFTFIKTSVSGKKFTKVTDFAVVADQSIKFAKDEILKLKGEITTQIESTVVAPLVSEIKALKEDNTKLANLAVTALSLSPIPLEQKKALLPILSTIGTVSEQAAVILKATITKEELLQVQELESREDISESIKEI